MTASGPAVEQLLRDLGPRVPELERAAAAGSVPERDHLLAQVARLRGGDTDLLSPPRA